MNNELKTNEWSSLTAEDIRKVISELPNDIRDLIIAHNLMLGGGFIRATIAGEEPSDIDLFGKTSDVAEAAQSLAESRSTNVVLSPMARNIITPGRIPVQFVTAWPFDTREELLENFDFTVAQAVISWCEGGWWHSKCSPSYYADLAAKRLVYCSGTTRPGGSMLRVLKYARKGYRIDIPNLSKVIAAMAGIGNTEAFEKQLFEVDPLQVVDSVDTIDPNNLSDIPVSVP